MCKKKTSVSDEVIQLIRMKMKMINHIDKT